MALSGAENWLQTCKHTAVSFDQSELSEFFSFYLKGCGSVSATSAISTVSSSSSLLNH